MPLREKCPDTEYFLVRIQSESRKIQTRKYSAFGHFSRSVPFFSLLRYSDFCNPYFLSADLRFNGSSFLDLIDWVVNHEKRSFSKHILQLEVGLTTSSSSLFLMYVPKKPISFVRFSDLVSKYLISYFQTSFLYASTILGYLPNLKKDVNWPLVSTFYLFCPIKIFLV